MTAVRMFVCRQCDKPRHPSWRRTVRFVSKPPTFVGPWRPHEVVWCKVCAEQFASSTFWRPLVEVEWHDDDGGEMPSPAWLESRRRK